MDISPKTYFPEWTLVRMYSWPNGHFPENLFSRIDTCQSVHLMLAIIIQEDEIKLFCSVNWVTTRWAKKMLPLLIHTQILKMNISSKFFFTDV